MNVTKHMCVIRISSVQFRFKHKLFAPFVLQHLFVKISLIYYIRFLLLKRKKKNFSQIDAGSFGQLPPFPPSNGRLIVKDPVSDESSGKI